ncbi:uncharacterized protein PGTG_14337 [Puccinia graminis f. sp. tritici CRL 75-36-700-3]|uniref:Uncharacterized protein n=1 Tax=Puccinia graminis f. sp. tritici (strain CRL 75-36-700-3 / race SCCL) TaxID=418459 RepID=E3KVF8_PUCGT|nr:uncharacterized protein PGTG_14337 [Puccinia graminis f. sp. tritici CRL 75-36-700-3]EFP88253.1 hypothetical protein PGTG_14337 [Puccinia graminis f. sp. tritici CRL 75-36-700-3]
MNISLWRDALERAGLLGKYRDVLHGFEHGFDQGIPDHRIPGVTWYTPNNHLSASLAVNKVLSSMEKELEAGQMFGPFSHEEVAQKFSFFPDKPFRSSRERGRIRQTHQRFIIPTQRSGGTVR